MTVTVTPMTSQVLGADTTPSHCQPITLLGLDVISEATFLPRVAANAPQFSYQPSCNGRMGVFAASTGSITRAWILLLPESGTPDRVMFAILPSIGQAADYYGRLHAGDPLSVPLIRDAAALVAGMDPFSLDMRRGKVQACYGSQVLGSGRPMALLVPVRAFATGRSGDPELGPFASDGQVIADTVAAIATATGGAFRADAVEGFTHSNGIDAFNMFLQAIRGRFTVRNAFALDPAHAQPIASGVATSVLQHISGQTGGIAHGRPVGNFEYWPMPRWRNDPQQQHVMQLARGSQFQYLHNYAFPRYLLRFSIQMTMP
ncbi:hypothetical protein [Vineibacter terrae]|uniref:hypothetical protein n=1 Tax=Vineibacter terrae TaxID=2586908 RepID=UPI002E32E272|nr:hypothetical protein [Vineibacter terrae]HEX2891362.1 hypothetical protein [Vineibacter terrae]